MLRKEKRRIITWGVRTHPALCALLHAARLQHSLCDLGPGDLGLRGPGRLLGQPQVCSREPAWASTASRFSGHSPGPVAIGGSGSSPQAGLCGASLCPLSGSSFSLPAPTDAWGLSDLRRPLQSWIPPFPTLTACTSGPRDHSYLSGRMAIHLGFGWVSWPHAQ